MRSMQMVCNDYPGWNAAGSLRPSGGDAAGEPHPAGGCPAGYGSNRNQPGGDANRRTAAPSTPAGEQPTAAAPTAARPRQPLAPVTSKELNLYGWSEYIPQQLLDDFTKEYGVKVNYDTYSSNEEMLAKLQAGASGLRRHHPQRLHGRHPGQAGPARTARSEPGPQPGQHRPAVPRPVLRPRKQVHRTLPVGDGRPGGQYASKVTDPVNSWADLWDPAFKDRVVLLDDEREVLGMVLLVLGYDKNSTDPAQLEEAKAKDERAAAQRQAV